MSNVLGWLMEDITGDRSLCGRLQPSKTITDNQAEIPIEELYFSVCKSVKMAY